MQAEKRTKKKHIMFIFHNDFVLLYYFLILTFSKQAFNESLDFCNRSQPHETHKYD